MVSSEWEYWKRAADEEYVLLMDNCIWKFEDFRAGRKVIEGKWLFRRKFKFDGSVDRYKVRYVVRGFRQISGLDYFEEEFFLRVVRIFTVMYLFVLSAELNLELEYMDVYTVFLNGEL